MSPRLLARSRLSPSYVRTCVRILYTTAVRTSMFCVLLVVVLAPIYPSYNLLLVQCIAGKSS